MKRKLIVAVLFVLYSHLSYSQIAGFIDSTFNSIGIKTYDFGFTDNINDVKIQGDQKILLTGVALSSSFVGELKIIRLKPDGTLDNSFANNGVFAYTVTSETYGIETYIRDDGKIVVLGMAATTFGYYDILLLRLNANGTLDTSFGNNGYTVTSFTNFDDLAQAMTVQKDGKILVSGTINDTINYFPNPSIIRFTEDGFVDASFGVNGKLMIPAIGGDNELNSIKIQNDGKIVASGHWSQPFGGNLDFDFYVVRADSNGVLDTSFGTNGSVITSLFSGIDEAYGMDFDSFGNIFLSGFTSSPISASFDMVLLKYDTNGVLDPLFGNAGIVTFHNSDEDVGYDLEIQPDNKIVVAGTSGLGLNNARPFAVWRYNVDGTPDLTFGINGFNTTSVNPGSQDFNAVALQADGKIVAAGKTLKGNYYDMAAVRYHVSNSLTGLSENIASNSFNVYPNPFTQQATIDFSVTQRNATIKIYDFIGKEISSSNFSGKQFVLERNSLSSGLYYLQVVDENQTISVRKLIIE